jgi:hypothetical protein
MSSSEAAKTDILVSAISKILSLQLDIMAKLARTQINFHGPQSILT